MNATGLIWLQLVSSIINEDLFRRFCLESIRLSLCCYASACGPNMAANALGFLCRILFVTFWLTEAARSSAWLPGTAHWGTAGGISLHVRADTLFGPCCHAAAVQAHAGTCIDATHLHVIELGQEVPSMHHACDISWSIGETAKRYHARTLAHLTTGKRHPWGNEYWRMVHSHRRLSFMKISDWLQYFLFSLMCANHLKWDNSEVFQWKEWSNHKQSYNF